MNRNIIAAVVLLFLTACQATPKRVAYTTLNSVAIAVDAARGAYVEAYKADKIDAATHDEVIALDLKFSKAMNTAISAAEFNWGSPPTQDLQNLAFDLIRTIGELTR